MSTLDESHTDRGADAQERSMLFRHFEVQRSHATSVRVETQPIKGAAKPGIPLHWLQGKRYRDPW